MNTTEITEVADAAKPGSISYLALGDSYTIGEAVNLSSSFPYQLVSALKAEYPAMAAPVIIARTGWRTDELIAAIEAAGITRKFDYVTLLIGVNNQYQGRSIAAYRADFIHLLQTAVHYANGNAQRAFVISVPDWGVTPYAAGRDRAGITMQIDQFNAINRSEAQRAGVSYINITDLSRQAAVNPSLIAPDGLHPSAAMYELWVHQRILRTVELSLKQAI